ncbi:MAG: hypothetical protein V1751_11510 [Pseudomonadota bacterium]
MDWDDGYDNGHQDMDYVSHRDEYTPDKTSEGGHLFLFLVAA